MLLYSTYSNLETRDRFILDRKHYRRHKDLAHNRAHRALIKLMTIDIDH